MWTKGIVILVVVLLSAPLGFATLGWIQSVSLDPAAPTDTDSIDLTVLGGLAYLRAVDDPSVSLDTTPSSVQLDLVYDLDHLMMIDEFSHTEPIPGTLSAGDYDLTVRLFTTMDSQPPELADTFDSSFTVTPEPTTLWLLAMGAAMLGPPVYARRRRG
jgi:hypothetical protein